MPVNLQVTYRDFPPPALSEERIRERLDRLCKLHPRITGCHVVAESPHHHHRKGRLYRIRIDLTVPGGELVINRDHHDKHGHEDFYVALRDAFQAAERRLQRFAERQSGDVKSHEGPPYDRA